MIGKFLLTGLLALGSAVVTRADIVVSLLNSSLSGAPGDTLAFIGTLANNSATDRIWLNGIGTTASSSLLSIDATPFFIDAPLYLDPFQTSDSIELFDVTIDPAATLGPENGNFVSILGGADGGAGTAFDDLADVRFDVDVKPSFSEAPEPSEWTMICAGALVLSLAQARRFLRVRGRPVSDR